ncbi:PREDICTED: C-type lectin domain family 4 member A-like isoform X2 [Condylura cristata]|uniref:C-type lectin domain family 4 member A-like isoform X2 n=1 Tax=Condylura cristata TaxID=143302 RepID=UPI000334604B|nr:PREDICTED: C-type lectin domain family 4 member A-like isoform X2 [Condylura cristata]
MTSEITYAEVKFKTESKSSGTKSKASREKAWSCCPKNWKSFDSNCYFIASEVKDWKESEKNCSAMQTHLLVVTSKEEQDFISSALNSRHAYYVGLLDPEGKNQWQWVDHTPFNNRSATFWNPGEPNNFNDRCVILLRTRSRNKWGWNNVNCGETHMSICKMTKIYL